VSARVTDQWHTATVELDGDEPQYVVHHLPTCPRELVDGIEAYYYDCLTGYQYVEGPDDDRPTEVGTFRVRGWEQRYEATIDGGVEWEGGLEWEPHPEAPVDA
jgi:hypothetical protein